MPSTIIPQPRQIQNMPGYWQKHHQGFNTTGPQLTIGIQSDTALTDQYQLLGHYLQHEQLFNVSQSDPACCDILLSLSIKPRPLTEACRQAGLVDEQYQLIIKPQRVALHAATERGIAMGIQTLRQLLSGQHAHLQLPCMIITDQPAMAWRGLHLDTSRHYFDTDSICRFIDLAAMHKFNVFHWHLTDDQGWRLPIDGYDRLTEIAAWRDQTLIGHDHFRHTHPADGQRHGGIYSHQDIRRIVNFASKRGLCILPEVDVPGHVQALIAAYPEFGCTDTPTAVRTCWGISPYVLNLQPGTMQFLNRVMQTLADLFPFRYVHCGGDEAQIHQWTGSEMVQQRCRALGISDDHAIQPWFTAQLQQILKALDRLMIGWDELIEHDSIDPSIAVMHWRDSQNPDLQLDKKALQNNHALVLANWSKTYFDQYQVTGEDRDREPLAICGQLTLEDVYHWQPQERLSSLTADQLDNLLGAQGQLWTEYIPHPSHLDYMTYPRACALSQVLWTGINRESWTGFDLRLSGHLKRLDRLGVKYRRR